MIVKLQGGLGNQIFIAAFGFSEAARRNEEVWFDLRSYATDTLRHYELSAYDLPIKILTDARHGDRYYEGYFQDEKLFDKELVYHLFNQPKGKPNQACEDMARKIVHAKNTCFMGVRRGDYLWPERINFHGVMPREYYYKALSHFPVDTNVGIFTDDIPWCKENLPEFEVVDVNGPDEKAWDIWLMSLCQHAIIANSSFHFFGAYLGADRNGGTIIAPQRWYADTKANKECQTVPERWQRI